MGQGYYLFCISLFKILKYFTMKKIFTLPLLLLLFGCDLHEFEIPELKVEVEEPHLNTSIKGILERVKQNDSEVISLGATEDTLWMEVYVTSSDAGGNFYKELFVQDAPVQAESAIRILLDKTALHNDYPLGRKIYTKLNGLAAGYHRGVLSLGYFNTDGIEPIPFHKIDEHLVRSHEDSEILPAKIEVSDFNEELLSQWVELENVQFSAAELGRTFAAQAFDQFDGERRMLHCQSHHNVWISTSTFSKFKSVVIPEKSGTVRGILTRDYYDEKYIIKVNSPNDLDFEGGRCDAFFEEHFENTTQGKLEISGWLNYTAQGSPYWKITENENTLGKSAEVSAYASGDENSEVWLITPAIDLSLLIQPYFAFRSSVKYGDKSELEVFISKDFNGNPDSVMNAHWEKLPVETASRLHGNNVWIDSGAFPLDEYYNQEVHFGFKYSGSGKTTYDATFYLDDIRVLDQ